MDFPTVAQEALSAKSEAMPAGSVVVRGYDFNKGVDYPALLQSFRTTGFQAMHFGQAVEEVNKMIDKRRQPIPEEEDNSSIVLPDEKPLTNCTIFLGLTSNMISSGVRETIRHLVEHSMVDCLVCTAGGIEEDLIKCLAPCYLGSFSIQGKDLRKRGINRIGNLLIPNDNYVKFEEWITPIWNEMLEEQKNQGIKWTPSRVIARLGKEINDTSSVCYWAYKNNIPIFSPALTDGALGDTLYSNCYKNPGLVIDIIEDLKRINNLAVFAKHTGMIILGGGLIKHHICNANLMRNGADFAVFINTGHEFDGSDSGAQPDEAVSWGKIKVDATPVKVCGDATFLFPLLVAETFAKDSQKLHGKAV